MTKELKDTDEMILGDYKEITLSLDQITNKKDSTKVSYIDEKKLNFTPYNKDYYKENYKGFPEEWYEILANSSKEEDKVVDMTDEKIKVKIV